MKFMKRVVLITGCSSGFGYETAKLLSASGYSVYATVRKEKDLSVFSNLPENNRPHTLLLDVTWSQTKIENIINEIISKEKRLDVLINNAGFGYFGALRTTSVDELESQFETNLFGLFKVIKSVLPQMRLQKNGLIINLSSIFGLTVSLCYGAYSASKYALEALSHTLRLEEAESGIQVVCVNPGSFETAFRQNKKTPSLDQNLNTDTLNQKIHHLLEKPHRRGNPKKVALKIKNIIETQNPKANYLIGLDALGIYYLSKILPLKTRDKVTRLIRQII
jgi:short-subunit dehydrogenase